MGSKRYKRELYDHPKASLLPLKARMVRSELVEALVWMRDIDPPEGPLRQAPYNTPEDVASNSRSLVQVAEQAHPLVQRRPSANRMREHRNNRAHEEVAMGGGAAPHGMGDHRLPKRIMSGELENAEKRGPGRKEKEWTNCVADDLLLFGITGD